MVIPGSLDVDELALRVREKRLARGLSVRQAAQEANVSPTTFSRVERGAHLPDRENLLNLARWVGISLDELQHHGRGARDDRHERNVIVHRPGESTSEAVALHLRADKDLSPEDARILMEVFRAAYENLKGRHE